MNTSKTSLRVLRPFRNLLLAALPILGLAGCGMNAVTAKGDLAQSVADAKSVVVASENGSVQLVRDDAATTMQITATVRCSAATDEKAQARVQATKLTAVRDQAGKVTIGVEFPPNEDAGSHWYSCDSASIVIRAAALDGIEVATSNGSIDVGAFSGAAKLTTSNGSIEVKDHAGPVDARSSNGRIQVSLASDAQGDVSLATSNGSVSLELGEAWQGTVTADTSNGRLDLAGGEVVKGNGSKTMTIGDAAKAKATIDTSNGRVTVRAATK